MLWWIDSGQSARAPTIQDFIDWFRRQHIADNLAPAD